MGKLLCGTIAIVIIIGATGVSAAETRVLAPSPYRIPFPAPGSHRLEADEGNAEGLLRLCTADAAHPPDVPEGAKGEQEAAQEAPWLTRRQKVVLLNAGAVGGVLAYGLLNWDYGRESWTLDNEGWFGRTTDDGGMDKLGHFWSAYAGSHLLAAVYEHWDYSASDANLYGALSSFAIQAAMEAADAFSGHGFSYEDFIMNTAGAITGYIWGRYPGLKSKIDFRMEYTPGFDSDDIDPFSNYEAQRYLLALKADGFEAVTNPALQYLELHLGYFARNYEDYNRLGEDNRRRTAFVGIGFSLSKVFKDRFGIGVLDYIQIPYTSFRLEYRMD